MSRFEIKMPKLGESITEGTIVSWSVKVGDTIQEDDILFEVNTAKVSAEIPSPVAGKVVEILYKEGDTVAVGTVVAVVDLDGEESSEETTASENTGKEEANPSMNTISDVNGTKTSIESESQPTEPKDQPQELNPIVVTEERWYSPVVIQLAREANIPKEELDTIQGTGYEGRLSKKDIKDYIDKKKRGLSNTSKISAAATSVSSVKPASSASASSATTASVAAPKQTTSTTSNIPGVEVKEMDRVRRIIADHMVMSKKVSPHVTNIVEVDVTKLVRWRDKNKDAFFRREGVKLTYMPAITEAVAKALAAYPQVNVSVDGYNILFKKHINVGIAVSLNDGNLIVPVVHDADRLNLNGLAVAIDSLAIKARDNKLMPEDIDGGTFTITNFGTFKSLFGTPIINQPQVAILGVGYIEKKPAVVETPEGDTIAIRHKMYLSLSYDHRVVDGMLGGNFLHFIADYLENWKG
ncbi:2-oxoglutarate dehydrogenase E2 component (dihydrolipoamide succinyltransferase) [Bacteroides faecichinchillae]|uniref:Dihydrolipoamide acetyltransferase component of pyruvate dehydrogenase complex n=1 Tax=Bacteroides faecichinchillae TaxID=871325 RepID=A0A1M4ZEP2_9BACE|nr:dihydrolipoamide acetyltransferase family protein [Bacteroides faecichinchillae]THG68296.1 2-oxo acid dehydrogenase subunit E2 [Bacteroides faecichinchillae]SHF16066.1 2-oxoglutarate dehydrogenase E2 component (dihydrolipoamide succinyltransferase) [Bacteroides faecichinchillae]